MDTIVSDEIDPINRAVPRCDSYLVKTGPSQRPSRLASASFGEVEFASLSLGHHKAGRIHNADDMVIFVLVRAATPGGVWDGSEVVPGRVSVYLPGMSNISNDRAGLEFGLFIAPAVAVKGAIGSLGRYDDHDPASVLQYHVARRWVDLYDAIMADDRPGDYLIRDVILGEMARALSTSPTLHSSVESGHRNDRRIVTAVQDYLIQTNSWRASAIELGHATGLSERRVQVAFQRTYDMTPSEFLRGRALSAARSKLMETDGNDSVSRVALDHGFNHLGRFSHYYRSAFGELPSSTLVASRRS